ncbi:LysE family transporter [Candidatus Pelagibacter sp.]|jgi:threonine/homoserine/homoserine lactone efflux protein|nr:LysE family transporter [Candidatus Pelagibacter sp.]MDB3894969.1 LysE family transporter [Candidatus Pelagibacter sp.]MDB9922646.1 LysE family transporter [Candidatus Pelagibacter sp.]|tara:strand:- start:408 stop:998 length:591 start_codon:yes stop_codon:yes gene_type:complete
MHPEILSLSLFMFVTSCSPGPNNVVASHSGFNHGIKRSIPLMLGVIFGFTTMLAIVNFGLINIFNIYPIIQKILIGTGTIFLIYLAYKISFSKSSDKKKDLKPVSFTETFLYQFLNPKGVIVAVIAVSTYTESGINFMNYSLWMLGVAFLFAIISIIFWTFLGKFMRKFATNDKFIKWFNYVMSTLLISCIATFYY